MVYTIWPKYYLKFSWKGGKQGWNFLFAKKIKSLKTTVMKEKKKDVNIEFIKQHLFLNFTKWEIEKEEYKNINKILCALLLYKMRNRKGRI